MSKGARITLTCLLSAIGLLAASAFLWFASSWTTAPKRPAIVFTNPTPRLQGGIGVSYDTIVTKCGKGMVFEDPSPQSGGSMRYFGQADGGVASIMVMGKASDLAVATLTVRLPASAQRAMCDGTEVRAPPAPLLTENCHARDEPD